MPARTSNPISTFTTYDGMAIEVSDDTAYDMYSGCREVFLGVTIRKGDFVDRTFVIHGWVKRGAANRWSLVQRDSSGTPSRNIARFETIKAARDFIAVNAEIETTTKVVL